MGTAQEKSDFLASLSDTAIASDAFFPFRDSIDHAQKLGVKFVAQPGGSNADEEVIKACDTYGMTMAFTDLRLFTIEAATAKPAVPAVSARLAARARARDHVSARGPVAVRPSGLLLPLRGRPWALQQST